MTVTALGKEPAIVVLAEGFDDGEPLYLTYLNLALLDEFAAFTTDMVTGVA